MRSKIIPILSFLFIISCKDESKVSKKLINAKAEFSFNIPDTLYINKGFEGIINYKSDLDTITTQLNKLKKFRSIVYTFIETKQINYSDEYLKKIVNDTFYSESNKTIPIYIEFDKLGVNYIDGIITDQVIINTDSKNKKGETLTRIITNEFRATKKVIVINDPKQRGK